MIVPARIAPKDRTATAAPEAPPQVGALRRAIRANVTKQHRAGDSEAPRWTEMDRILNVPVVTIPEEALSLLVDEAHRLYRRPGWEAVSLKPEQAIAVLAYRETKSGFLPMGVGYGKTLVWLLQAEEAVRSGIQRVAVFVPPTFVPTLQQVELKKWRTRFSISYQVHYMTAGPKARMALAKSKLPGVYIIPYSILQAAQGYQELEAIAPGLVILDEAHQVKAKSSARTKRLMHYVKDHKPQGIALSGTMTSKSLMDYHHLAAWILGERCPMPIPVNAAQEWAGVVDPGNEYLNMGRAAILNPLVAWAQTEAPSAFGPYDFNLEGVRHACRARLRTTPGVYMTGDQSCDCSLEIHLSTWEAEPALPPRVKHLIDQVERDWVSPDGDIISWAFHKYHHIVTLRSGFYYRKVWPEEAAIAKKRGISESEAADLIKRSQEYEESEQLYKKAEQQFLQGPHQPGLDTPMLVGNSIRLHGGKFVPSYLYQAHLDRESMDFEGRIVRESKTEHVDPFWRDHCVKWATQNKGLLWYQWDAFGDWLYEGLEKAGVDFLYCPAGDAVAKEMTNDHGHHSMLCSIPSHWQSKNLQYHSVNFMAEWCRPAFRVEQLIGRTHRQNQKADTVSVIVPTNSSWDRDHVTATIVDSAALHQLGSPQKLIVGTYDPIPKIPSVAYLKGRGFELAKSVESADIAKILAEKFG